MRAFFGIDSMEMGIGVGISYTTDLRKFGRSLFKDILSKY